MSLIGAIDSLRPKNKIDDASLTVDGQEHKGWQEISVTRSLEQFAHSFDIGFTEQWTDVDAPIPIREGNACTLSLNDEVVTTGYVDEAEISEDSQDHMMRVSGRSITADLVDCSAIYGKGHWKNATLETIATNLIEPFGISMQVDEALGDMGGPFPLFSIHDGETVYETLDRACRMRGILMTTSSDGQLVFTAIGLKRTATVIERGVNARKLGRMGSWKDRYSQYTIKAQSAGTPDLLGHAASQQFITVQDTDVVLRYRPLIIKAETGMGSQAKLQARATWEMNVRAGRSLRLRYQLDGWENEEGLWEPNTIVRVKDDRMQVDSSFLVVSVQLTKGSEGTNTDLELCDPRAMTIEPLTKQPKGIKSKQLFAVGSAP